MEQASLHDVLARLARRLEPHLAQLRARGRTRRTDPIGGLAIELGDAEGILAELATPAAAITDDDPGAPLSHGLAAFDHAAKAYGLSPFERDALLLAMAPEIDARFCRLFGFLNDSVVALRPTVGLAVAVLARAPSVRQLAAFLPGSNLDRFGLLTTDGDGPLAARTIRIASELWPRLAGLRAPGALVAPLPAEPLERLLLEQPDRAAAHDAATWLRARGPDAIVVIEGCEGSGREALARAIAAAAARPLLRVVERAEGWPTPTALARESLWYGAGMLFPSGLPPLVAALLAIPAPLVVVARHAADVSLGETRRPIRVVRAPEYRREQRAELWRQRAPHLDRDGALALVDRYRFGPARIEEVVRRAADATSDGRPDLPRLRRAAAESSALRMDQLANRETTTFAIDDLVVAPATRRELDTALAWARRRAHVFGPDGAGQHLGTTDGLACLFWGPPGTGKTMAAKILAREAGLDLYRVDLAQVVDKYVGETEKRLAALLDEAERGNAVVFFDEADTLFGRRTSIHDAHDRYANIETGFLLQRLERTTAVVVLASNLKQNLDPAFLRRMHVVAEFPAPGPAERRALWEHLLPRCDQRDPDVDLGVLAAMQLTGGEIRNAVATAVVISAEPLVSMTHLVWGVCREMGKAGRLVSPGAFGAWHHVAVSHARGAAPAIDPSAS